VVGLALGPPLVLAVAEVMGELGTEGALENRFLEAVEQRVGLLRRQRPGVVSEILCAEVGLKNLSAVHS
jgi:hypothetical protein